VRHVGSDALEVQPELGKVGDHGERHLAAAA
jgi:hypothetical protein